MMTPNILVVDDEEDIRGMLDTHFSFMDYNVHCASNGVEALERMEEQRYDVVVSDIMMPEMDGVQLLQSIRDQYPMTRVIMITGYVSLQNAMDCMNFGADNCIFKPLDDMQELENAIKKAIDHISMWTKKLKELQGLKPGK